MLEMMLLGYPVVASDRMVAYHSEDKQLSWKDRLFSWPWRPWRKTKTVCWTTPLRTTYLLDGIFFMHPELYNEIKAEITSKQNISMEAKILV